MENQAIAVIKDSSSEGIVDSETSRQIDEAVKFINKRTESAAQSLLEIGQYLLDTFFNSSIELVRERKPGKEVSLRKLADHPDMSLTFSSLSHAVNLAAQEHLFQSPRYDSLTVSHKRVLFKLADEAQRMEYADIAVEQELSVRRLQDLLVGKKLIAQRGRQAKDENGVVNPEKEVVKKFISPILKLSKMNLKFEEVDPSVLTDNRIEALQKLRDKLNVLLGRVNC